MKRDRLRKRISEILVKWHMPTRQAAIDEILKEVDKVVDELREEYKDITMVKVKKTGTMIKCQMCMFETTDEDLLNKHTAKFHTRYAN